MRPQAHLASGLLAWSLSGAPVREAPVDALAANLPDLDRDIAKALGVERSDHHRWPSHSFVFWAPLTALAWRHDRARRAAALVWVHLALDTYADGLAWLWPLETRKRGLFRKPPHIHDDGWNTPAPPDTNLGRIELAMWLGTALAVTRRIARARRP
jgi:LexA-binding, inner membrane-associated putative hydrolase